MERQEAVVGLKVRVTGGNLNGLIGCVKGTCNSEYCRITFHTEGGNVDYYVFYSDIEPYEGRLPIYDHITPMVAEENTKPNPAETQYYDSHYTAMAGFEPIEVMQQILTYEELVGFLKGNIIKYSMRAGHKQGEDAAKDAAKANRYAQWLSKLHYTDPDTIINPKED